MVGLIVFMDDLRQFGFPLLERDASRQFVFIDCAKITARRGIVLSLNLVNLLFLNVFCRIIFCHFSISFSVAKIYYYLNCSILFLIKNVFLFGTVPASRLNPFCIHHQPEPSTIGDVFRTAPGPCVHFQRPKR